MRWLVLSVMIGLAGCVSTAPAPGPNAVARAPQSPVASDLERFRVVTSRVEPVAEQICRSRSRSRNCDFQIVVDDRDGLQPNAYQTLDRSGRPILAFTRSLLADVQNAHQLAFVMSHEAAHHIADHIPRQQQSAMAGAILMGGLASISGADSQGIDAAVNMGAGVGARRYSKDFELEADAIGTVIAHTAGYDPVQGAEYFTRIADPGDRILGSHPPNAQRIATVRRVAAGL